MFDVKNIQKLQEILKEKGLKAYLIFTSDPHNSEYVSDYYLAERKYFCPFTGSAGQVLITQDKAYLFADGRYWIQAKNQLENSNIELVKVGDVGVLPLKEFIKENKLYPLGVNFLNITEQSLKSYKKMGITLVDVDFSYLAGAKEDKAQKVFKLDQNLTTLTSEEKINKILEETEKEGAQSNLVTTLDDIAFILNIRGRDIPRNPVFYSYLYLSKIAGNHLFINKEKIDFSIKNVAIHDYNEIFSFLKAHKDIKTLVDPLRVNAKVYSILNEPIRGRNPSYLMKAIKGKKEIENTKKIQAIDGLALLKFNKYLDENLSKNLNEYDYSEKLEEFRKESSLFFDLSFDTIASVGPNAAMMHYEPTKDMHSVVSDKDIELLVDSGGQYYGGTTDTTRTFLIGKPTKEYIHDYTLTLKSLIHVSKAIFLDGSSGQTIDILARQFMWNEGMDYKCGTGHGVGYILNVHEGPNGFRYKKAIEPGVYKENKFGIRIENNLLCVPAFKTSDGEFYKFETITYVPIETRCLDFDLLTKEEVVWLNDYHKLIYNKLSELIEDEELLKYLKNKTAKIVK